MHRREANKVTWASDRIVLRLLGRGSFAFSRFFRRLLRVAMAPHPFLQCACACRAVSGDCLHPSRGASRVCCREPTVLRSLSTRHVMRSGGDSLCVLSFLFFSRFIADCSPCGVRHQQLIQRPASPPPHSSPLTFFYFLAPALLGEKRRCVRRRPSCLLVRLAVCVRVNRCASASLAASYPLLCFLFSFLRLLELTNLRCSALSSAHVLCTLVSSRLACEGPLRVHRHDFFFL